MPFTSKITRQQNKIAEQIHEQGIAPYSRVVSAMIKGDSKIAEWEAKIVPSELKEELQALNNMQINDDYEARQHEEWYSDLKQRFHEKGWHLFYDPNAQASGEYKIILLDKLYEAEHTDPPINMPIILEDTQFVLKNCNVCHRIGLPLRAFSIRTGETQRQNLTLCEECSNHIGLTLLQTWQNEE